MGAGSAAGGSVKFFVQCFRSVSRIACAHATCRAQHTHRLHRCTSHFLDLAYENYAKLCQLPKQVQDMFLHDHMNQVQVVNGQKNYYFLELQVCKQTLVRLLAIGKSRWSRVLHAEPDMRSRPRPKFSGEGPRAADVFSYLWGLYTSVAEHNPFSQNIDVCGRTDGTRSELLSAVSVLYKETRGEGDAIREALKQSDCLPKKFLPPASKREHHTLYVASRRSGSDIVPVSSFKTFRRVWSRHFKDLLGTNGFHRHAQCDVCSELKAMMRIAPDARAQAETACMYVEHQDAQMQDRRVYYKARELSRRGELVCIMQDGSDQEKYRVFRCLRQAKDMEAQAQHLPRLKLLGSWAHGYSGSFYFLEEDMQKDSSLTVEALFTTIEEAGAQAAAKGRSLPADLWIQLDNCSGENKNQFVLSALTALVKRKIFKSVVLAFLRLVSCIGIERVSPFTRMFIAIATANVAIATALEVATAQRLIWKSAPCLCKQGRCDARMSVVVFLPNLWVCTCSWLRTFLRARAAGHVHARAHMV